MAGGCLAARLVTVGTKGPVLEVEANLKCAARCHRSGIPHGTLEGPAKPRDHARSRAGKRTVPKARPHDARKFERSREVKPTTVRNGDVEGKLCLVCSHDRHVRARHEGHGPHGGVLHGAAPHQRVDLRRAAKGEVCRERQALVGCPDKPRAQSRNQGKGIGTSQDLHEGGELVRKVDVRNFDRRLGHERNRHTALGCVAGECGLEGSLAATDDNQGVRCDVFRCGGPDGANVDDARRLAGDKGLLDGEHEPARGGLRYAYPQAHGL